MHLHTPYNEAHRQLTELGWELESIKQKNGLWVAKGKGPGDARGERIGQSPELALAHLVLYAQRHNKIRAVAAQEKVAAWSHDFTEKREDIARAYAKLPAFEAKAVPAWRALADESRKQADAIRKQVKVEHTDEPEPYLSHHEMMQDVHHKKRYKATRANADHPVWTPDEVVNFRIVHDVIGHGGGNADYSWDGENKAASNHFPHLTPLAREALFVETLGRSAYENTFHGHGPRKVALMSDFLKDAHQDEGDHITIPHGATPDSQQAVDHVLNQMPPGAWVEQTRQARDLFTKIHQTGSTIRQAHAATVAYLAMSNVPDDDRVEIADEIMADFAKAAAAKARVAALVHVGAWIKQPEAYDRICKLPGADPQSAAHIWRRLKLAFEAGTPAPDVFTAPYDDVKQWSNTPTPNPCAITIDEPEREIEVMPLQPPVPLPAPEPAPAPPPQPEPEPEYEPEEEPAWEPEEEPDREREPAKVGHKTADITDENEAGNMYMEPVKGDRSLHVIEEGGKILLKSGGTGGNAMIWQPGVAAVASCARGGNHEAPQLDCHCGIYSVTPDNMHEMAAYTDAPFVVATLSNWGRIEVSGRGGRHGVRRAQYAYPYEIRVPAGMVYFGKYTSEELAQKLAQTYQVDAVVANPPFAIKGLPTGMRRDRGAGWRPDGGEILLEATDVDARYEIVLYEDDKAHEMFEYFGLQPANYRNSWSRGSDAIVGFSTGFANHQDEAQSEPLAIFEAIMAGKEIAIWQIKGDDGMAEWMVGALREHGLDPNWDEDAEQGRDTGYGYTDESEILWDTQETQTIDDLDDLYKVWRDVEQYPGTYTEFQYVENYHPKKVMEGAEDQYGLTTWVEQLEEYPPTAIKFETATWERILVQVINEEVHGAEYTPEALAEIAQALYGIPSFGAAGEVYGLQHWQTDIKSAIPKMWNDCYQYARTLEQGGPQSDQKQLFDTQPYDPQQMQLFDTPQQQEGLRNQLLEWFMRYLLDMFEGGAQTKTYQNYDGSQSTWTTWSEPEALPQSDFTEKSQLGQDEPQMPGTFSAVNRERKPDYRFVYYNTGLVIEDWHHNLRFRDLRKRLLEHFGQGETHITDDDHNEWASGDVWRDEDGSYTIDLKNLASEEVQLGAINAVHDWLDRNGDSPA